MHTSLCAASHSYWIRSKSTSDQLKFVQNQIRAKYSGRRRKQPIYRAHRAVMVIFASVQLAWLIYNAIPLMTRRQSLISWRKVKHCRLCTGVIAVGLCSPVFQLIVSCTNLEISAIISQNCELKTMFFGPKFFGEYEPQNQMRTFYSPKGTHVRLCARC